MCSGNILQLHRASSALDLRATAMTSLFHQPLTSVMQQLHVWVSDIDFTALKKEQ